MDTKFNKLTNVLNCVIHSVAREWNCKKLIQLEGLFEKSFEQLFKDRQTQEKTKVIAPILDQLFEKNVIKHLPSFSAAEKRGFDYLLDNVPLESKISFREDNAWTGNGFKKTPIHILMKFNLDCLGKINGVFACVVDLSICNSDWSSPGSTSNFSQLKLLTEDKKHLKIVAGNISDNKKYLKIITEKVN